MSEILVVPDIHGRDFWIEPCNNWKGPIVFLGDYHDPYPEIKKSKSYKNLIKLVEFSKTRDNLTFLIGNHEIPYFYPYPISRFDIFRAVLIKNLLSQLPLKFCHKVDNCLFSHSGILPEWLERNNLTLERINNLKMNSPEINQTSPYRYGCTKVGSCVWGDLLEYMDKPHLPDYFQVFGHTWCKKPIIQKDFAMLDCGKTFIINTETCQIEI